MAASITKLAVRGVSSRSTTGSKMAPEASPKNSQGQFTDDEILGLVTAVSPRVMSEVAPGESMTDASGDAGIGGGDSSAQSGSSGTGDSNDAGPDSADAVQSNANGAVDPEIAKVVASNPQVRQRLEDVQAYRAVFPPLRQRRMRRISWTRWMECFSPGNQPIMRRSWRDFTSCRRKRFIICAGSAGARR